MLTNQTVEILLGILRTKCLIYVGITPKPDQVCGLGMVRLCFSVLLKGFPSFEIAFANKSESELNFLTARKQLWVERKEIFQ